MKDIPYLRACLKESYRVNNTAPFNARILPEDIVLQGYKIPAGTMLEVSSIPYCLDDKVFENAAEYIPDRWVKPESRGSANLQNHPFMVLPFGVGPRMCIGGRVAESELMAMAAALVQRYHIEVISAEKPRMFCDGPAAFPNPTPKFKFSRRNN